MAKFSEKGFMNELIKSTNNEFASILDEETISNVTEWIDTGSYSLNGIICGDIFKGIPNNKIIAFAGAEQTGKTYLLLSIAEKAIQRGYKIAFFDSENAVEKDTIKLRGMDPQNFMYFPIDTVENFRGQLLRLVNAYNEIEEKNKPKLLVMLDSLGNLSTTKEIADAEKSSDKKDMTRPSIIKSVFRTLSLKMACAKIPMIITNHVYDEIGAFMPSKIMSGGSGLKYAASIIIYLNRAKAKDAQGNVCGFYFTARTVKNRYCKPETKSKIYLSFKSGLNKYYGLQDFGEPILKKESKGWSINGEKISEKDLWKNEWPKELMDHIAKKFYEDVSFGQQGMDTSAETEIDTEEGEVDNKE